MLFDLLVVGWSVAWAWVGRLIYHRIVGAQGGASDLAAGGTRFQQQMRRAASAVDGVPIVGDKLKDPFVQAQGAGVSMTQAGNQLGRTLETMGQVLGGLAAAIPIVIALLLWGVVRLRYAWSAGRAQALAALPGGTLLLALEALHTVAPRVLSEAGADPAGGWQRNDPATVDALARLRLDSLGL